MVLFKDRAPHTERRTSKMKDSANRETNSFVVNKKEIKENT